MTKASRKAAVSVNADKRVAFTLLENALDFIYEATGRLGSEPTERDLKYAVLHLTSGIELILKERLRQEHWALVFQDVDKANHKAYEAGSFQSVTFRDCLTRLKGVCDVVISDDDSQTLTTLRDKRNRLEHFGIVDTDEAIQAAAAKCLIFVLDFIRDELADGISGHETIMGQIRDRCLAFEKFVTKRLMSIKPSLAQFSEVLTCPRCLQETMVLDDASVRCLFCSSSPTPEEAAAEYVSNVLQVSYRDVNKGADWPLSYCSACGHETRVVMDDPAGGPIGKRFVCFACEQASRNMDFCGSCGEPYDCGEGDDYTTICPDCWHYQMIRD